MNLKEYQTHLRKVRKKGTNDKLVDSTIERYSEHITPHLPELSKHSGLELINIINEKMAYHPNLILHAAIKNYLKFRNEPEEIIIKLKKPPKNTNNALNSIKFLQTKILSRKEIEILVNTSTEPTLKLALIMLYETACRRTELLNITFDDIEPPDKPTKNIGATIQVLGKGKKSRTVCITPSTLKRIHQLKKNLINPRKQIIRFYTRTKKEYKHQDHQLYIRIINHGNTSLHRHVHPHMLRHTKATHLADEGADILGISAYLGHQEVQTTQIYVTISSYKSKQVFEAYTKELKLNDE